MSKCNTNPADISNLEKDPVFISQKGKPGGVPTLDINGKIPLSQISGVPILDANGKIPLSVIDISAIDKTGFPLTKIDDINVTLTLGGAPATALLASTSLNLGWNGQLSISRGGTGQNTAVGAFNALSPLTARGDLLVRDSSNNVRLGIGAANTLLQSNGTDPSWGTVNLLSAFHGDTLAGGVVQGDLIVGNSTPRWSRLGIGSSGQVLHSNGTDVSWQNIVFSDLPSTITGAAFVTIGNDVHLTGERALTGTADQIIITDNGANSTVVLSLPQSIATSSSPTFTGLSISALTPGQIVFPSTGGSLIGSNSLAWDNTNLFLKLQGTIGQQLRIAYDSTHYVDFTLTGAASGPGSGFDQYLEINPATAHTGAFFGVNWQCSDFTVGYSASGPQGEGVPNFTLNGVYPGANWYASGQALDSKLWTVGIDSSVKTQLNFALVDDANTTSARWMYVTRAVMVPTVNFPVGFTLANNNSISWLDSGATSRPVLTLASDNNLYFDNKAAGNFTLRGGNPAGTLNTLMTLSNAGAVVFTGSGQFGGNVGIGRAPTSILDLFTSVDNGNPILTIAGGTGSGANVGQISYYANAGSAEVARLYVQRSGTNDGAYLAFFTKTGGVAIAEAGRFTAAQSFILNNAALAANATAGFFYIAGTPTLPTGTPEAFTGRYPLTWNTGDKTAELYDSFWRSISPLYAYKGSDQTITNSTTLTDDNALTVNVKASRTYRIRVVIFQTSASVTAGIKLSINGTCTATSIKFQGLDIAGTPLFGRGTTLGAAVGLGVGTGDNFLEIEGTIEVNAAGTLKLQWAQNTADAVNGTTVQQNSYMELIQIG